MFINPYVYYITHRYGYIVSCVKIHGWEIPNWFPWQQMLQWQEWVTLGKELSAQKKTYRLPDAEAGTKSLKSLSLLVTLCKDDELAQDLL